MIRNCSSYLIFPLVAVRYNYDELVNLYESFHFHLLTGSVLRRRHTSGLKTATYATIISVRYIHVTQGLSGVVRFDTWKNTVVGYR